MTTANITPISGTVTANARLNIRKHEPSIAAAITRREEMGAILAVRGLVQGDNVSGNAQWYAGDDDTFFWSGACGNFRAAGATSLGVNRRPNGTIEPLSEKDVRQVYGTFPYTEAKKGAINIDAAWAAANIVTLPTPVLADNGYANIKCHAKARGPFERVFAAIAAAGLDERIVTCAGTFVPRHKGWNPKRGLSVHSWGLAIDFNVAWNPYGGLPAALGAHGSVRELVPYFEAEGFAWGGYFQPLSICDGMHFELARYDL
jgi:hypothetical protein